MISVVVVDDSAFMRKVISEMLSSDPEIKVLATAINGRDGIKKIHELKPDVATIDIEMPDIDGVETVKELMVDTPLPLVLISGSSNTEKTIEALNAGAFDFILKPSGMISLDMDKIKDELVQKIKAAYKTGVKKVIKVSKPVHSNISFSSTRKKILVIASSTGGPSTLEALLLQIPKNIPVPILIVQHMPAGFTKSFAERLNAICDIEVREAIDGDELQNGVALIAPGNFHMELKSDLEGYEGVIRLNQLPQELGVRPNANRMFISVADIFKENTIGVVLTGMGNDGTEGSRKIKQYKGTIIAEAEESCVIYGMPKCVVDASLADLVVTLDKMGVALLQAIDV